MQRLPWADKYGDADSIPVEELLNHGWHFNCETCGAKIEDIKDFHVNSRGFCCKRCFNEWEEETRVTGIYCYPKYNFPITLYECNECGAVFLDRDDDYKYCPYCGRKIVAVIPVPPLFRKE